MSTITRREFMRLAGATVALAGVGVAGRSRGGAVPARILVIGGGYAGAIAARYAKAHVPDAEVTLVERDETYVSCPFSNEVLSGGRDLASLSFGYAALGKAGVSLVTDEVIELDPVARTATTRGGKRFATDFLVVAPGIAFRWDAIPGYDEAASALVPHAWKAGPQTLLLKSQIEAMPDGGLLVIVPPPTPYRCPPGPYERAAQIAHFLTRRGKSKSKVLILDPKDAFSKKHLFLDGWKHHYGDMIEWVPGAAGGKVGSIDPKSRVVRAEFDEFTPDVLNVIPPQKAGPIAEQSGLTDERGWCPVAPASFESTRAKGVYVVGDACNAGAMAKAAYSSNTQAKVAAAHIASVILGAAPPTPAYTNTCWSLIAPDYGISAVSIYTVGPEGRIIEVPGAGGTSPADASLATRRREAVYGRSWFENITRETFG